MPVYLATKTIEAINAQLELDQGASYRKYLGQVMPHIGDAYNPNNEPFRSHMGASGIGKECERAIWYSFHWYTKSNNSGRMVRLFNRGHMEEGRFIALLLSIGVQVYQQDAQGKQFRVSNATGHFGGSGDGVAVGVPDIPNGEPCLAEFKTAAEKSFKEMVVNGVQESKYEHYVQMQVYMHKMGLRYAFYCVVNKNNDELYAEIIIYDPVIAQRYYDKAEKIVFMQYPPHKLHMSPGYFKCKQCDHHPVCHLNSAPAVNCRTCKHSTPTRESETGEWTCMLTSTLIDKDTQLIGCVSHEVRT